MSTLAYTRIEARRTFRNKRFFIFSLVFPLALYFIIAAPNKGETNLSGTGISAPEYFMISLASWGTMVAMLSTGARIATERSAGWNRQLRISPLSARAYLSAKVALGYAMAILSLVMLYAAGAILGVSLPAGQWLEMTGLILVGLIPFGAAGVLLGHLLTPESAGPAVGGGTSLLAIVSGTWFPIGSHGFVHDVAQFLPSYWLVQSNRVVLGGSGWSATGWIVVLVWGLVLGVLAARAYVQDTKKA
jgi:ABC-2 type transport system permease protein